MATTKLMTTTGAGKIVDLLDAETWYGGIGTGGTGAVVGDTALTTEVETRDETTDTQPSAVQFQAISEQAITGTHAIDEAGLFDASTTGVMMLTATFDIVNLESGDTFEITWQQTLQDSSV